jgi:protocatechuate 3,4-dioxygenase beta subunit
MVDVWHCDAKGLYSGVDSTVADDDDLDASHRIINTQGETFLRGYQVTDDAGKAPFKTVYPGWYVPRLTHIHVKVTSREFPDGTLDTQLYFPPEVEVAVFQTEPYAARGPNPIGVEEDIVMKGDADGVKKLTLAVDVTDAGLFGCFQLALTKFES